MPQPPQLATSLARSTSQPFDCRSLSQLARFAAQVPVQTPPEQAREPATRPFAEQTVRQKRQLSGSLPRFTSQPSPRRSLLQSAKPIVQVPVQAPGWVQPRVARLFVE